MKLFTKDIDKKLFAQYPKGSDLANQMVVAKIFNPYGRGTWYIINSDPDDPDYLWAIVDLFDIEAGSVSRSELENILVPPFRLNLERDTSFSPTNALELYKGLRQGKMYQTGGTADSSMSNDPMIGGTMASSMARGGDVGSENAEMVANNIKQIAHHTKEMAEALKGSDHVPAWVVSKVYRASSDLSDATHYMDGESNKMAEGGNVFKSDVVIREDKSGNNYLFPNTSDIDSTGIMMENGGDVYSYDTQEPQMASGGGPYTSVKFAKGGGVGDFEKHATILSKSYGTIYIVERTNGEFVNVPESELEDELSYSKGKVVSKFVNGVKKYAKGGGVGEKNINVVIQSSGKGETSLWHIIEAKTPFSYATEVFFDSKEEAKKFADKKGFNVVNEFENEYAKGGATPAQKRKIGKVMHEWKSGKLHSGSKKGPVVKSQEQAVAIALSEAGLSKNSNPKGWKHKRK